jgi:hypothetical protein
VNLETFAARRKRIMVRADERLEVTARRALRKYGKDDDWYRPLVNVTATMARRVFKAEGGKNRRILKEHMDEFKDDLRKTLEKTTEPDKPIDPAQIDRIAHWLSTTAINAGTLAAAAADKEPPFLQWLSMDDQHVRLTHEVADNQIKAVGEKFKVGKAWLRYPGDPTGPPEEILNCRCILAPTSEGEVVTTTTTALDDPELFAAIDEEVDEVEDDEDEVDLDAPVPWHAILAPEGITSGDGRMFTADALRWRDLPLPLGWQKATASGHDGAVVIGRIDNVYREDGMLWGEGVFDRSEEADTVIGQIAEGFVRGISVDVDDATMQVQDRDGNALAGDTLPDEKSVMAITDGRVCGATVVTVPAFNEAVIHIGAREDALVAAVSDKPWSNFTEADYSIEQWHRACLIHLHSGAPSNKSDCKLPVKEPSGALNRNGVHAAAAAIGGARGGLQAPDEKKSAARRALRGLYRQLGEDPPESLTAALAVEEDGEIEELALDEFKRGPGWVTEPKATRRIHAYWTRGKGAAKIRWGQGGDFNRCKSQLAKYVESKYLNRTCALWHHDALGYWPSTHRKRASASDEPMDMDCVDCLVAAGVSTLPADWFNDPELPGLTPITITDDGHMFGHVAGFGTCHVGIGNACVTPPHSATSYAYFHTGSVRTTDGDRAVGHISLGGGHADLKAGYRPAMEHYDSTSTVVADVAAGEDAYGIWVNGAVRAGTSEETLHALRAAGLSGDWRRIGGTLELVAVLAVNVPGFPVPRIGLAASVGTQTALVASGVVTQRPDDFNEAVNRAIDGYFARRVRADKVAVLRASIGRDAKTRAEAARLSVRNREG